MDAYEGLISRVSPLELSEPGPSETDERRILAAALRAPDHGRLRPWRFLIVKGNARHKLGEVLASALAERDGGASDEVLARERAKPLRAPLVIVAVATVRPHPKIPAVEQLLAVGAAVQNILLASQALGFGAQWKTGDPAYDPRVKRALGLDPADEIVSFVYIGTPRRLPPMPEPLDPQAFAVQWPAG